MNSPEQVHVEDAPVAASEPAIGEQLARARQAHSLSVTDVANRLKLSIQQVEALEKGEYDRLPGPVFVRGFARNYARLLNLDPAAVIRAIDARLPRAATEPGKAMSEANIPMPARTPNRWPIVAGVAAVVFLGAALIDVLWPEVPQTAQPHAVPGAPQTPPAETSATASAEPVAPAPETAAGAPPPPAVPAAPGETAAAMPATYTSAAATGNRTLRFVFEQASWVQVRDASGNVVLEALYPAGASREIEAQPPLTLVIGNAPGVKLTYGERAVDLAPHTRVAVARLTLE